MEAWVRLNVGDRPEYAQGQAQPASVDLHLNPLLLLMPELNVPLDPKQDNSRGRTLSMRSSSYLVPPGGFVLGATMERVSMPIGNLGRIEGKSSLGRLGLQVHVTAGFIDPGFTGNITLEIHNVLDRPWRLYPGMPICQLSVAYVSGSAVYEGKYRSGASEGPQASLYHLNWNAAELDWRGAKNA